MNTNSAPLSPQTIQAVRQGLEQAQAHLNAGNAQQAEAICRQILANVPGEPNALHMLGLMAHAMGDQVRAVALLRQACQSPAAAALYHSNLAEMLRRQGGLAEAEVHGCKAVALDPQMIGAWNNLGIILQESGQLDESLICLEKVVALDPRNPSAHNNLGNTCKRLGNIAGAQQHWQRALALNPNYAEPYSNLASLCKEQGQYDLSMDYGQRAIRLNPGLHDAYINLAATETARWRHAAAIGWLNALLRIAPDHAVALASRASSLKEMDQLDEALGDAQRAAKLRPDNAEVQSAYGSILLALGRFDEAIACFDLALSVPSAIRERLLVGRAMAFQENGDSADALRQLDAVLAEFPDSAAALHGRADIVKFKAGDPAIAKMQDLTGPGGVQSFSDRMSLHFALGKAFLDTGDSDAAFRHLNEGNAMKRSTIQYDPDAVSRWLGRLAEAFSPALLEQFAGAGAPSSSPIFIVGMPRSGTTLIEQILASHPAIDGAGELKFLSRLADQNGGMPDALVGMTADRLREMGDAYLSAVAAIASDKPHVVDKMPANFMYVGLIRMILPKARIIHARRDPVDTCLSCYSKLFGGEQSFTYDMAELGRFHRDYQALMAHWRDVVPASHLLEVDYEDVIGDIETQARRMLDFLGLPWDPACLAFHETKRPVRTASVNQVRQPVYKTSAGRWRAHADNLAPLLTALGGH